MTQTQKHTDTHRQMQRYTHTSRRCVTETHGFGVESQLCPSRSEGLWCCFLLAEFLCFSRCGHRQGCACSSTDSGRWLDQWGGASRTRGCPSVLPVFAPVVGMGQALRVAVVTALTQLWLLCPAPSPSLGVLWKEGSAVLSTCSW